MAQDTYSFTAKRSGICPGDECPFGNAIRPGQTITKMKQKKWFEGVPDNSGHLVAGWYPYAHPTCADKYHEELEEREAGAWWNNTVKREN